MTERNERQSTIEHELPASPFLTAAQAAEIRKTLGIVLADS